MKASIVLFALPAAYEPEVSEAYSGQEMNWMFEIGHEPGLAGDIWPSISPGS